MNVCVCDNEHVEIEKSSPVTRFTRSRADAVCGWAGAVSATCLDRGRSALKLTFRPFLSQPIGNRV